MFICGKCFIEKEQRLYDSILHQHQKAFESRDVSSQYRNNHATEMIVGIQRQHLTIAVAIAACRSRAGRARRNQVYIFRENNPLYKAQSAFEDTAFKMARPDISKIIANKRNHFPCVSSSYYADVYIGDKTRRAMAVMELYRKAQANKPLSRAILCPANRFNNISTIFLSCDKRLRLIMRIAMGTKVGKLCGYRQSRL